MPMKTFSFRAECVADVQYFGEVLAKSGVISDLRTEGVSDGFPDVAVEMRAESTLGALQGLVRQVEDGHVMLQTLRLVPLVENSLERDYDLI